MGGVVTPRKLRGTAVAERPGETPAPRRALLKFGEGVVCGMGFNGGDEGGDRGEFAEHRGEPGVVARRMGRSECKRGVEDAEDKGDFATGVIDHFSSCAGACLRESVRLEF